MRFVDEVRIYIRSGKGGDGCVSFLREKGNPKGGPDGGDGGRGGDLIFVAEPQLSTLLDFRYQQHHKAEDGEPGMGRQKNGRDGKDTRIKVPVGTMIIDDDSGELIADLAEPGSEVVAARGGKRGRGNMNFATSTNQAPRRADPGGPAEELRVRLSLKLLADVGLVGFPNAGKSTLISRISKARPKIADYPFTTLVPNLGIVRTGEEKSFAMADIPGLIEGASEGAGLGIRFLKHVERVSVLVFLLDVSGIEGRTPVDDYETLKRELEAYSPELLEKPRVIVLSKADLPDTDEVEPEVRALAEHEGAPFFKISAVRGDGLDALAYALQGLVDASRSVDR
jgi:GTPase